jgi:D-glycero-D-manno-heptose 1,7-bisphosphate phosphatase
MPDEARRDARAIFMDRDGTVSEEVGYMYHAGLYRLYPWTGEAIRKINESGMKSVLVTNQSGVGRGYFNESTVHEVHQLLRERPLQSEAQMDGIYYCPHVPETDCACRKPKPGMILQAARDLEIDLSRSFMIGDRYTDVLTAHAAGIRSVLVCSGDGANEKARYEGLPGPQPHFVAENLLYAVDAILSGLVK